MEEPFIVALEGCEKVCFVYWRHKGECMDEMTVWQPQGVGGASGEFVASSLRHKGL